MHVALALPVVLPFCVQTQAGMITAMFKQTHRTYQSLILGHTMKTLTVILIAGLAFVAGSPAFAGRDESQMMQTRNAAEAKNARQLAQEKQTQQGLAGATGVPGKIGPAGDPPKLGRNPAIHP